MIVLVYAPAEIRKSDLLNAIMPAPSSVTITGVTSLSGGSIRFDFNVPEGTNNIVESSEPLIDWQIRSIGIGLTGGEESCTHTVGANAVRF